MAIGVGKNPTLRPCPWCHSEPKLVQEQDSTWHVACTFSQCPVTPITVSYRHRHQAVKVWNFEGLPDLIPRPVQYSYD